MTAYHTGWVWRESGMPSTAKFILLALADQAPDNGDVTIDLAVLRAKTSLGRDAIRYALRYLQDHAYLVRVRADNADMDEPDRLRLNPSMQRHSLARPPSVPADLMAVITSDS